MSKELFAAQINTARKLANEKGIEALRNPHALIGKMCRCGDCFCCAALLVYTEKCQEGAIGKSLTVN